MPLKKRQQKGAALITALFITALAAILATAIALREELMIHEAQLIHNSDQAYLYLQASQNVAINELEVLAKKQKQLNGIIYTKPLIIKQSFAQGNLYTTVTDISGKFNINLLNQTAKIPVFQHLLQLADPDLEADKTAKLALYVSEWITPSGADDYYSHLNPPYRAAHRQLTDISELLAIRGFNAQLYNKLIPYLTALPTSTTTTTTTAPTSISANSVSPVVLATLSGISLEAAQTFTECRISLRGFTDTAQVSNCWKQASPTTATQPNLVLTSQYFIINSTVVINQQAHGLQTLVELTQNSHNQPTALVIWQRFNMTAMKKP